jgi:hypothetical protein
MDKKEFANWTVLYTVILSIGSLVLVYARAGNQQTPVSGLLIVSTIAGSGIFGALIAAIQLLAMKSGAAIWLGSSATPVTPLTLSRVRTLIRQESWLEAREELAGLWESYPGNADILQEYEHMMVDRMHAPSGFADFLIKAVPVLNPHYSRSLRLRE